MKECIRQGDLLFIPVSPKPDYQTRKMESTGYRKDGVIQEGEATGHHHRLEDPLSADLFRPGFGTPFVVVKDKPAKVVHDGSPKVDSNFHGAAMLEANTTYDVHVAQEDDGTGRTRRVMD
jgi:hypothetical protein